jgi:hypothetical protein
LVEVAIAVFILLPGKLPAIGWALSFLLHSGIILVIGLFSFGTIMIGTVLAAAAPSIWFLYKSMSSDSDTPSRSAGRVLAPL